ncbi:uncharacterized protein LOC134192229 isoform X1 [Corticium candelabrum]|uniref:uncharacterized protein LOC134192229 isoform X1 n=1 Tax=Corticium candelabrum TaxID=121492 RepID=UPI002E266555|nr:uncharacterized protein LOC134192229 isoform X1 [Corticium candelabrum]
MRVSFRLFLTFTLWHTTWGPQPSDSYLNPPWSESQHPCSTNYQDCYECVSDPCSRTKSESGNPVSCVWCDRNPFDKSKRGICIPSNLAKSCISDKHNVITNTKGCLRYDQQSSSEMTSALPHTTCGTFTGDTYYLPLVQNEDAYGEQRNSDSAYMLHLNLCRNVTNATIVNTCGSRAPLQIYEIRSEKNMCWNIGSVSDPWPKAKVETTGLSFQLHLGYASCCSLDEQQRAQPGKCLPIRVTVYASPGNCETAKPQNYLEIKSINYKQLTDCHPGNNLYVRLGVRRLCNDVIVWQLNETETSFECFANNDPKMNCTVTYKLRETEKSLSSSVISTNFLVQQTFVDNSKVHMYTVNSTVAQLGSDVVTLNDTKFLFTVNGANESLCSLQLFYIYPAATSPLVWISQFNLTNRCLPATTAGSSSSLGIGLIVGGTALVVIVIVITVFIVFVCRRNRRRTIHRDPRGHYGTDRHEAVNINVNGQ